MQYPAFSVKRAVLAKRFEPHRRLLFPMMVDVQLITGEIEVVLAQRYQPCPRSVVRVPAMVNTRVK
jgi:hypothetical protein